MVTSNKGLNERGLEKLRYPAHTALAERQVALSGEYK